MGDHNEVFTTACYLGMIVRYYMSIKNVILKRYLNFINDSHIGNGVCDPFTLCHCSKKEGYVTKHHITRWISKLPLGIPQIGKRESFLWEDW